MNGRSRWFLLIDLGLILLMIGNIWVGVMLYNLIDEVKLVKLSVVNPTNFPPVLTITLPGDIGFMVQAGRVEGTQVIWSTLSPGAAERVTFLPANKGGEYSQSLTIPRCDTLCITGVRKNPLTP